MNKCILCGKCVGVCREVQVTEAIKFTQRGFDAKVAGSFDHPLDTVVLPVLRPVRRHVPHRRAHQPAAHRATAVGPQQGAHHLPVLRRRLQLGPHGRRRQGRRRQRRLRAADQRRQAVRQGPLRLRVRGLPGPPDAPADPQGRHPGAGLLGRGAGPDRPSACGEILERARRRRHRRPQLGTLHQRGELPRAEARAARARHQQRRQLRHHLPRADRRRSGRRVRQRRDDQQHRRDQGLRRAVPDRGQPHRGAPDLRPGDEAGAAARREADRRRPAAHLDSPSTRTSTSSTAPARDNMLLNAHDALHPRRGPGRPGLHRRALRGLRGVRADLGLSGVESGRARSRASTPS